MADEGKETAYQEGNLQLGRVHDLQIKLNNLNLDLVGFNDEFERYNYLIKFDCLNTLFSEISSSCDPNEKKKASKFIKGINNFLKTNSPYREKKVNDGWGVLRQQTVLYRKDFDLLRGVLFEYELWIKSLLHKYFRRNIEGEGRPKEF
ncbi:hypothetical protein LCGC14_0962150 [marine sediment metagenome]|uniref:Uncharacterized protein n=1 Tax=marine sediment metagenome TaxID=412755 RepID=A0A0F9P0C6_9ZZZZ